MAVAGEIIPMGVLEAVIRWGVGNKYLWRSCVHIGVKYRFRKIKRA